ncbi:MAG: tRNA-dihydrouridine synthase B [Parasphingorhabdus sp.]
MFNIGPYTFDNRVFLAPMAGITDLPFRRLCRLLGAGHAISEMTSARPEFLHTRKSKLKRCHLQEYAPAHVQIAGYDPQEMADAAVFNVQQGADIIDINMGCPAKKVCNRLAGSALLRDEGLVQEILQAVVEAVTVPVTLKTRTGWDIDTRNALNIACIAEQSGIAAFTLHGRTRCDFYKGQAEHQTLVEVKKQVSIPVIANGDIDSLDTAKKLLEESGADGIMIGRAAQQAPWLPGMIAEGLTTGKLPAAPDLQQKHAILARLAQDIHHFYGENIGLRMARKHIAWQLAPFNLDRDQRNALLRTADSQSQLSAIDNLFRSLGSTSNRPDSHSLPYLQIDHEIIKAA